MREGDLYLARGARRGLCGVGGAVCVCVFACPCVCVFSLGLALIREREEAEKKLVAHQQPLHIDYWTI